MNRFGLMGVVYCRTEHTFSVYAFLYLRGTDPFLVALLMIARPAVNYCSRMRQAAEMRC